MDCGFSNIGMISSKKFAARWDGMIEGFLVCEFLVIPIKAYCTNSSCIFLIYVSTTIMTVAFHLSPGRILMVLSS